MSALDDAIRAIVREELRASGVARPVYTSTSLPPGITSREHFAAECRRLRIGTKHGRVWSVDAQSWHEARRAKRRTLEEEADALLDSNRHLQLVSKGSR